MPTSGALAAAVRTAMLQFAPRRKIALVARLALVAAPALAQAPQQAPAPSDQVCDPATVTFDGSFLVVCSLTGKSTATMPGPLVKPAQ